MRLVIDISEDDYRKVQDGRASVSMMQKAIRNGTQLPKGHGRLIDESDLIPDSDYEDGMFYAVSIGAINGAPTIIEADNGESEDKCKNCKYYRNPDYTRCHECEAESEDKE
jgi:hypothetical protein